MGMDFGSLGKYFVGIGVDLSELNSGMRNAVNQMESANKNIQKSANSITDSIGGITRSMIGMAAGYAGLQGLESIFQNTAVAGFQYNSMLQQATISFSTMLGGAKEAEIMLKELEQFAAVTPFEFKGIQENAKYMLAMGFSAKELLPSLRAIGDAAAGLGSGNFGIERIIRALGQMRMKGKVSAEEMRQLAEANIPAWQILADAVGVSTAELQKMTEKGVIPAEFAIQALVDGMEKRFPNMMEVQSKSFQGLMSTLRDNIDMTFGQVMKPIFEDFTQNIFPLIIDLVDRFSEGVKNGGLSEGLKKIIPTELATTITAVASAWATYEAITIACSIATGAHAIAEAWRTGAVLLSTKGTWAQTAANVAATLSTVVHTAAVQGLIASYVGLAAAMSLNPVYLAVAAIVAVVAAAVYLIKYHFTECKRVLINVWNAIVDGWTYMLNAFLSFPTIALAIGVLSEVFSTLGEVGDAVFGFLGECGTGFGRTIDKVATFVSGLLTNIGEFFNDLWRKVTGATDGIGESMRKFMNGILPEWAKSFIDKMGEIMDKGREMASSVSSSVRNALHVEQDAEDERKAFNLLHSTNGQRYEAGKVTSTSPTLGGGGETKKSGKEKSPFDIAKANYDFDVAMHQYSQEQKLAKYHEYVDEVEKTDTELMEYQKTVYSMDFAVAQENLNFKKAALEMFVLENEGALDAIYQKNVEVATAEIALYAEGTLEYKKAMDARKKLDIQYAKDKQALAYKAEEEASKIRIMGYDNDKANAQFLYDLGWINKEKLLQAERDYTMQVAAEQRRLAEIQANNMLLSEDKRREYADKIVEIDLAMNKELQANAQEMWKEQNKSLLELKNSTASAFQSLFTDLLTTTTKVSELLRNFAKSILKTIATQLANRWANSITDKLFSSMKGGANKEIAAEKAKQTGITAVQKAGEQARLLNSQLTGAQIGSMGAAQATTMIAATQAAYQGLLAMMSAMASAIAAIPPEGSAMSAQINAGVTAAQGALTAATSAANAGVNAAFAVKSGAGGYKVPYDQLMKVHEDEVVLPARLSKGFENIINSMGGGSTTNQVSVPVKVDGNVKLAGRLKREVEDLVVKIIAQEARA